MSIIPAAKPRVMRAAALLLACLPAYALAQVVPPDEALPSPAAERARAQQAAQQQRYYPQANDTVMEPVSAAPLPQQQGMAPPPAAAPLPTTPQQMAAPATPPQPFQPAPLVAEPAPQPMMAQPAEPAAAPMVPPAPQVAEEPPPAAAVAPMAAEPVPVAPAPAVAAAPVVAQPVTPLVIIRFSQHNVYYEKALYNAVNRALEAKRTAMFQVVLKPGFRSTDSDANLARVVGSLHKMGLPDGRLSSSTSSASGERFDEVDVYVR